MAAFNRPTNANYVTHENVTVDTLDNEDHTFCGIMFPIKCKDLLPVDHLVIKSVAVRGRLGPLTVWVSKKDANYDRDRRYRTLDSLGRCAGRPLARHGHNEQDGEHRIPLKPSAWTKVYEKCHKPCGPGRYTELVFDEPVCLRPGEMRAIYIHSTLPGDQAIVYDNTDHGNSYYRSSKKRFEDDKLAILTGRAHVSTTCFGQEPIWGWGNPWRENREFVGRLAYGTVYKLWNPEVQPKFGNNFQDGARTLFLCQRRWESPMSKLPDEAIFYILNMCRWDWFNDDEKIMKARRKREKERKQRLSEQQMEQEEEEEETKPAAAAAAAAACSMDEKMDAKPSANEVSPGLCALRRAAASAGSKTTGLDEEDEEDEDEEYVEASDDSDEGEDTEMQVDGDDDDDEEEEVVMTDAEGVDIESEESSEDEDDYHRATRRYFGFQNPESDDEEEERTSPNTNQLHSQWIRHRFARSHVLRALAAMEDQAINYY